MDEGRNGGRYGLFPYAPPSLPFPLTTPRRAGPAAPFGPLRYALDRCLRRVYDGRMSEVDGERD